MRYWHFLFVEMLYQLAFISIGLILLSLVLYYLSIRFVYFPRLSVSLVATSNFISIFSTMLLFAAMFSALIEAMPTEGFILFLLTCISFYVAFKVNHDV